MKILLISVGTRGDMEPFLAIGKMLQERGHEVACAFPEQFEQLTHDAGFQFFGLGSEFLDMIQSQKGRQFIGGEVGFFRRLGAITWFLKKYNHINENQLLLQKEAVDTFEPDRVVFHSLSTYPVVWGRHNPDKAILLSTVPYLLHPTREYSHIVLNKNLGSFLNRLSFGVMNYLLTAPIMGAVKKLNIMEGITRKEIEETLLRGRTIYTVSPTIFPKPSYWPANAKVVGFSERNKQLNWRPSSMLNNFLGKHDKILFITFGSMTNAFSREKTAFILQVLEKHNIAAIINTFAGGLEKPDEYNRDMFYFTESIPYDYIFPKVYAVVHHGGAGTTHMSLKYGKPSLIIPHILDQFFWNTKNHALRTGPKGVRISKLKDFVFEKKILDLWKAESYKREAEKISESMKGENFEDEICKCVVK